MPQHDTDEREALDALRERLVAAEQQLRELAPTFWESVERERVSGKAQGVQLALSYVDEIIRMAEPDADEREQGGEVMGAAPSMAEVIIAQDLIVQDLAAAGFGHVANVSEPATRLREQGGE